jgi:hypothetical protein
MYKQFFFFLNFSVGEGGGGGGGGRGSLRRCSNEVIFGLFIKSGRSYLKSSKINVFELVCDVNSYVCTLRNCCS